jgi:hypothetical protein
LFQLLLLSRGTAMLAGLRTLIQAEYPTPIIIAITSRPLLLQAIGRQTSHAGRTTVTITSSHGEHNRARQALTRVAGFFAELRKTA